MTSSMASTSRAPTGVPTAAKAQRNLWVLALFILGPLLFGAVLVGLRTRSGDMALRIRITRALNEGGGAPVDMSHLPAFTWTSMQILAPRAPAAAQREAGLPFYARWVIGLERRDDVSVLAFKLGDDFRAHVVVPRDKGDFVPAARAQPYTHDDAFFAVRRTAEGFTLAPTPRPASQAAPVPTP